MCAHQIQLRVQSHGVRTFTEARRNEEEVSFAATQTVRCHIPGDVVFTKEETRFEVLQSTRRYIQGNSYPQSVKKNVDKEEVAGN